MNILIMDSDCEDREKLVKMIKSLKKDAAIFWAESDNRGYEIALEYNPEIAVIDMSSPKFSVVGLNIAERLRKNYPRMNLIFLSREADNQIALAGFRIHISGYIVKPVTLERLEQEFQNLYYPLQE